MNTMLDVGTFTPEEKLFNRVLEMKLSERGLPLEYFVRFTEAGNLLFPYFEGEETRTFAPLTKAKVRNGEGLSSYVDKILFKEYKHYVSRMNIVSTSFEDFVHDLKAELEPRGFKIDSYYGTYGVHGRLEIHHQYSTAAERVYSGSEIQLMFINADKRKQELEKLIFQAEQSLEKDKARQQEFRMAQIRRLVNNIVKGYGNIISFEGNSIVGHNDKFGVLSHAYLYALEDNQESIRVKLEETILRHKLIFESTLRLLLDSDTDPSIQEMRLSEDSYIKLDASFENGQLKTVYTLTHEGKTQQVMFLDWKRVSPTREV